MSLVKRALSIAKSLLRSENRQVMLGCVLAAPAVIVLLSICGLIVLMGGSDQRKLAWYHREGQHAINAQDYVKARLCFSVLLQNDPRNQEYQFGLALSLAGLGDDRASRALIAELAPEDGVGYLPAHLMLAEHLLAGAGNDEQALRAAEAHLLKVVEVQPRNVRANALLAGLYSKTGEWDLVKKHLPHGGEAVEEVSLSAARQFAMQGDQEAAWTWARRAATHYLSKLKSNPKDSDARIRCAQAYLMLKDFARSLEVLEEGWKLEQLDLYRRAVAQVCGAWVKSSPTLDPPRRLALIDRGLTYDAQNQLVLEAILDNSTYDAARSVLPATMPVEGAIARALAQCVHHSRRNDPSRVRAELENAFSLRPDMTLAAAANLATAWGLGDRSDANSARFLAEALLQLRPTNPIAQRVMGLILSQQKQDLEATKLLEAAAGSMPQDKAIHQALAVSYERLGEHDLARHHRALGEPTAAATESN